jgi:hypothetical protein
MSGQTCWICTHRFVKGNKRVMGTSYFQFEQAESTQMRLGGTVPSKRTRGTHGFTKEASISEQHNIAQ